MKENMEGRGNKTRKAYTARETSQLVRFSHLWFDVFLTTYFGIPGCHASGQMRSRGSASRWTGFQDVSYEGTTRGARRWRLIQKQGLVSLGRSFKLLMVEPVSLRGEQRQGPGWIYSFLLKMLWGIYTWMSRPVSCPFP